MGKGSETLPRATPTGWVETEGQFGPPGDHRLKPCLRLHFKANISFCVIIYSRPCVLESAQDSQAGNPVVQISCGPLTFLQT